VLTMAKFKIEIDQNRCIGCGSCAAVCPSNYEIIGGKAKAKKKVVEDIGCNKEAENVCPVSCIRVTKV